MQYIYIWLFTNVCHVWFLATTFHVCQVQVNMIWFPEDVICSPTVTTFKSRLKTSACVLKLTLCKNVADFTDWAALFYFSFINTFPFLTFILIHIWISFWLFFVSFSLLYLLFLKEYSMIIYLSLSSVLKNKQSIKYILSFKKK